MSLNKLKMYLQDHHIEFSSRQEMQFEKFHALLCERNKVMNLTAVPDDEMESRHFIDSLAILAEGNQDSCIMFSLHNQNVIDIGTGGGFPGIPLAIMLPDSQFTLVDSLQKRISFLEEVVNECSLENVRPVCGRFEELARDERFRCSFDLGVSRAVADLRILLEYSLPFIRDDGFFAAYKSGNPTEEIQNASHALSELCGEYKNCIMYQEYDTDVSRSVIIVKRSGVMSDRYPRRNGIPSKRPL